MLQRLTYEQAFEAALYNQARIEDEGSVGIPIAFRQWTRLPGNMFLWGSPVTAQAISEMQRAIGIEADGKWGPKSTLAYKSYQRHLVSGENYRDVMWGVDRCAPGSLNAHAAMALAREWRGKPAPTKAEKEAWDYIISRESGGWLGRPNYTADRIQRYQDARVDKKVPYHKVANQRAWAVFASDVRKSEAVSTYKVKSSAVCVGQLLGSNWVVHCPLGRAGIGEVVPSFAAMDSYMEGRYSGVLNAAEFYDMDHCPEDRKSYYSERALAIGCKPGEGY